MLYILITYFAVLFVVSRLTAKHSTDSAFYHGERKSPWYLVAFGMIGASISGVTFVSVPGMVLHSGFTYLEVCTGFIVGYFAVAYLLLPIYYRENLTSIYTYLNRISHEAYMTGTVFFIISKLLGASAKFYVPCFIISRMMGWSFPLTVIVMLLFVWLYTRRVGIKTLVWTDSVQTLCMLVCLGLIIYNVYDILYPTLSVSKATVGQILSGNGTLPETERPFLATVTNFISGIFIVIVMTGLDQDMMQKNLTCRTLRDAQKDMCTYGFAFLPVNALFLLLGVMLVGVYNYQGIPLPDKADDLLTLYCTREGGIMLTLFMVGIVATSFSSLDRALTALTTTVCTLHLPSFAQHIKKRRTLTHLLITLLMAVCCIMFERFNTTSLIDAVYILVSYTYGPLLGLFTYAMTLHSSTTKAVTTSKPYSILLICLASPLLCYALSTYAASSLGYRFGYELLLINGLLTYLGLWIAGKLSR